jgi:CRP/FNR family transcriptional regulator, cyclic AMP receptor protein
MPNKKRVPRFDARPFLANIDGGATLLTLGENETVFTQGDPADSVFLLDQGKVKVTVLSHEGKEAVLAILGSGDFFGEGCLTGQPLRMSTVSTMTDCRIMRLEKAAVVRLLHDDHEFSEKFMTFLLHRNLRVEEDLVDQLFNSSEKRLARILLLMANIGKDGRQDVVIPKVSQEVLAQMVGTTRARVNSFMNKFRRLGFIEYNGKLEIHSSLLNVILHD